MRDLYPVRRATSENGRKIQRRLREVIVRVLCFYQHGDMFKEEERDKGGMRDDLGTARQGQEKEESGQKVRPSCSELNPREQSVWKCAAMGQA